jgi:hypothetical protein
VASAPIGWPAGPGRDAGVLIRHVQDLDGAPGGGDSELVAQRPQVIDPPGAQPFHAGGGVPSRWRLRRLGGTGRPSWRHSRAIFLRFTTCPSRASTAWARRYPDRGWASANARSAARRSLSGSLTASRRRWAKQSRPIAQARRCGKPSLSWSICTARRRRDGLTSFPGRSPSAPPSPPRRQPAAAGAPRSPAPAPSAAGCHRPSSRRTDCATSDRPARRSPGAGPPPRCPRPHPAAGQPPAACGRSAPAYDLIWPS